MSRDDREDLKKRIAELRDRAGERPDLIESVGVVQAAEWWFDPETTKRIIPSSLGGSQQPVAVVEAPDGAEYSVGVVDLWTGAVASQDPDVVVGDAGPETETEASG